MGASGCRMPVQRTEPAKIATDFSFIGAISAVVGLNALGFAKGETGGEDTLPRLPARLLPSAVPIPMNLRGWMKGCAVFASVY